MSTVNPDPTQALERIRRSLSFLINRKLAMGFKSWLGAQAQRNSMSRALLHLMNRELSRGWVGWHSQWLEARRKLASMSKSLLHLMNRQLSAGWNSCLVMATERRQAASRGSNPNLCITRTPGPSVNF